MLAGWEGSANDFTVLKDALRRPNGLKVPQSEVYTNIFCILVFNQTLLASRFILGKYYLVDAGYTTLGSYSISVTQA